jgi:hypothetical protein
LKSRPFKGEIVYMSLKKRRLILGALVTYFLCSLPFALFSFAMLCDQGCFDPPLRVWMQAIVGTVFWPVTVAEIALKISAAN